LPKTAFLASSTIAPDVVLRCYDWATAKHEGCVVSGFSSKLEQDVLHFLLKAKTPVIMVLARRMYREIPEELKVPLEQGRLLIISTTTAVRQSRTTALARNRYVCELADQIMMVGVTDGSSLYGLQKEFGDKLT
jgi:predicted Rossmann fold nucleotide-binding protein DprA/Smf involved in DNA uptake